MNRDVDAELRDALTEASECIVPSADLAGRVMRAARGRRRVLTGVLAAALVMVTAGTLIAVREIAPAPAGPSAHRHHGHHRGWAGGMRIAAPSAELVAASAGKIYLAGGDYPTAVLAAYDRRTGRLIRRVSIPALPSALRIGPGGLIWLCFYPGSNGGGTGVWLLSPDLARRSGVDLAVRRYHGAAPFDVLPAGRDSAILATDSRLARVRLPLPGQPGSPRLTWLPLAAGADPIRGLPVGLTSFAGRVVVRLADDAGRTIITFAGRRPPIFSPGPSRGASSAAASASGLWVTTFARGGGQIGQRLVRLDARLRPDTPASIRRSRLLAGAQQVVTLGGAVWAFLPWSPWLACFADHGGRTGPVETLNTGYTPVSAAAVGDTIYVVGPAGVASYRIPHQCR
jgi:hypothetical protein